MYKQILLKFAKFALSWGAEYLYNYVDKNDNGVWEKEEIEDLIFIIRDKFTQIKRKI